MDEISFEEISVFVYVVFLILGLLSFRYEPDRPLPPSSCFIIDMAHATGLSDHRDTRCADLR